MDKNLLYEYAQLMAGRRSHIGDSFYKNQKDYEIEAMQPKLAEQKRAKAYYLIWFVYRYILRRRTLEDTEPYANEETLRKYRLLSYVKHSLYLGLEQEIRFHKPEDIHIILEILYCRYNLIEQFDCFIRNTKKLRRRNCEEVKEKYRVILEEMGIEI